MHKKLLAFSGWTNQSYQLHVINRMSKKSNMSQLRNSRFAFSSVKKQTKYILSQFPYPSGDLHLGHARVYLIGDTLARFYKLRGFDVLYPMGWDSFGLPAENAAIVNKQSPKHWTQSNIQRMKNQLNQLDIPFPWQRQISTCTPEYYRWTQWIFLKMYELGLAYKSEAEVNWDPVDKTVLANEQVDQSGHSWRSGAKVEKRVLSQWFLRIRQFAEDLDRQLSSSQQSFNKNIDHFCTGLGKWVSVVKDMQKGWIGLKKGYQIKGIFKVDKSTQDNQVQVFIQQEIFNQITKARTGFLQVNLNQQGEYNDQIVGTIDFDGLSQIKVRRVRQLAKQQDIFSLVLKKGYESSNNFQWIKDVNKSESKTMRLKDWLISRQRYWGTPIPIIYCGKCGIVPVPQSELPVVLPQWPQSKQQIQNNTNPLLSQKFKRCKCPKCGDMAQRQTDTMDTFVDSSWYYLRFLDPNNTNQIINPVIAEKQMPVHIYIGGMQHAIMHLLYARFVYRVLHRCGITSKHTQPFQQLIVQGLIKGKTYKLKTTHAYLKRNEVAQYSQDQLIQSFQKMSKSKFNGVSPGQIIQNYTVDQLRLALLFAGPPQNDIDFHQDMLINARRFLSRIQEIIKFVQQHHKRTNQRVIRIDHRALSKYSQFLNSLNGLFDRLLISMDKRAFHAYIANIMELTNLVRKIVFTTENVNGNQALQHIQLQGFASILWILSIVSSPVFPHFCQQIQRRMEKMNVNISINRQQWPVVQRQFLQVLVRKGSKIIKKNLVEASHYDQANGNRKLTEQLGLRQSQVISIKRLKKNVVIVIR